jgi:hypothetical protein
MKPALLFDTPGAPAAEALETRSISPSPKLREHDYK